MKTCEKTAEEIRLLVEKNLNLANKLAHRKLGQLPAYVSFDELQSAAYMGLVEAANRFDEARGFSFTTYAFPRISGAINDYLRELGLVHVSLDSKDEDLCLKDTLISKENASEDIFESIANALGNEAACMLRSYCIDNYSMREVGQQHGISEGRVSQLFSSYKKCILENLQALAA